MISIIIATYNSGNVLEKCLESLLQQSNKAFEIIIVDGKSSDNTMEIVQKYGKHISYSMSEPDKGIYDAWNKALPHANGDWIMFLGSDDTLYPDTIKGYHDVISDNQDFNYILSKAELVSADNRIIRIIGKKWNYKEFRRYMGIVHTGSVQHKSLFEQYGNFNVDYKIAGDYEFLLRAGKNIKAGYIDKITMRMAIGGVSTNLIHKVFYESFKAKVKAARVNIFLCFYDYFISYIKFYIGKILK